MVKTTFTVDELNTAIQSVIDIDRKFPDLPVVLYYEGFWAERTFPLTFKKVGENNNVIVQLEELHIGGGLEAGDNIMHCIISTGYGENKRYFKKTGFLDSWDNGEDDYKWDGELTEVIPQEVTFKQWKTVL
jgi:hypothetical protein